MTKQESTPDQSVMAAGVSRRRFLGFAGGLAGLGLLTAAAAGCKKDDDDDDSSVNLGSGDIGILNYAYALEQLEAAFYTQVIMQQYSGMTNDERSLITDIRDHEIAHREFFKAALGSSAIRGLTPNFSAVNFADRNSVLTTAKTFEDLGVSAYNGAGKLIVSADYLLLAGKIVSVEARHAAYIRDLLVPNSFADNTVVDTTNGLDVVRMPTAVLAAAQPFIFEKINGSNLPTT
jgi:hypothetical protein